MKAKIIILIIVISGIVAINSLTTPKTTHHPEFRETKIVADWHTPILRELEF